MHAATSPCSHYLVFGALFHSVRSLSFPCDAEGHVAMDGLSDRARDNYLYARTVVGRDYTVPVVIPAREAGDRAEVLALP